MHFHSVNVKTFELWKICVNFVKADLPNKCWTSFEKNQCWLFGKEGSSNLPSIDWTWEGGRGWVKKIIMMLREKLRTMRENNQIIKSGDNDGLRSTQYLQCFAIFCGLGCQMSPYTLFSQKKPPREKVFINQLNFQTFSTVFRTSENHRSLLISSSNKENLARVKYLLTFRMILIFDILRYSTWTLILKLWGHFRTWYLLSSSNDFDDLCWSPLTAKLSRDIFVTTTFPLFSDNLPELPLVHCCTVFPWDLGCEI